MSQAKIMPVSTFKDTNKPSMSAPCTCVAGAAIAVEAKKGIDSILRCKVNLYDTGVCIITHFRTIFAFPVHKDSEAAPPEILCKPNFLLFSYIIFYCIQHFQFAPSLRNLLIFLVPSAIPVLDTY